MTLVNAINPKMLSLIRETKGLSQKELATELGITQGFLSRVESGYSSLAKETLDKIAELLDCPLELLQDRTSLEGMESVFMFHRRRMSKIKVLSAKKIEAIAHLTRITVNALSKGTSYEKPLIEKIPIAEGTAVEDVVSKVRDQWVKHDGPIDDMSKLLDDMGIVVLRRDFDESAQDAFSTWPEGKLPIIVIRKGMSGDRERFTLAHELGHLILHTEIDILPTLTGGDS